jgi:hypothetical protein
MPKIIMKETFCDTCKYHRIHYDDVAFDGCTCVSYNDESNHGGCCGNLSRGLTDPDERLT